jgi:hypothetical protein
MFDGRLVLLGENKAIYSEFFRHIFTENLYWQDNRDSTIGQYLFSIFSNAFP